MNNIYKIETYSDDCTAKIAEYITQNGGCCVIQGWAVITDYSFNCQCALELLPLISTIHANISEYDIHQLNCRRKIAA